MSDFPTRNALMIAKQMAPQGTSKIDFYNPKTYTPPVVPHRPIAEDYKNGVPLDDRGNLSRTIEGRPLTAQVVAGRSTLGSSGIYPDRGIDPQTLKRLGTETGGASFLEAAPRTLKARTSGELETWRDPETGNRRSVVTTRNDLSPEGGDNVRAHEVAHLFDWISGTLPVPSKGPVRDQMEQVYHHLATGKAPTPGYETKYGLVTPEAHGYFGKKADKELAAESIRSYLTNPNYLKTAAPKAAALIRNHFNDHPYLSKFLQFNSAVLALLGSSGMYADGGMVDEDTPNHSNITKASGGMTDDPAKSIRRAVMVAKGLAKKIDQLPSGNRMQAPHPASVIPGVHVTGMDGAQGYADGGSTPAWQRKEGQNPSGGLNSKGRASYHSETGGTLKPPVKAGDNPRRSSFLARMGNMPGPEHDEHGEPTRLLKSLQAWGASSKADARAKAHAIHKDGGGVVEPTDETGFVAPEDRKANLAAFTKGNHPLVPQVLYHGTDRDVRSFDAKAKPNFDSGSTPDDSDTGWYSKGFYLTPSRRVASFYADPQNKNRAGANVMPVHLSMKNPYILNVPKYDSGALNMDKELDKLGAPKRKGFTWRLSSEQTAFLKSKGYDGVIMMRDGVPDEFVAHDPNQIKSAIGNQGTYNPNDHAIHKDGGGVVEPTDETGFDAWHGTPHTFAPEPGAPLGRFRSDKIGTGEGAQAFGHGLYVGQEGTARGYRDKLKGGPSSSFIFDVMHKHYNYEKDFPMSAVDVVRPSLGKGDESIKKALTQHAKKLKASLNDYDRGTAQQVDDMSNDKDLHEKLNSLGGHLLHVRVRANPEHFLDWDKPLSEQHPHVQAALENLHGEKISPTSNLLHPSNKGEKIYYGTAVKHGKYAETNATPVEELLKQAGIPGIRYLDANSRDPDTDQPTHNHVIFDPSIIDIKHRYARGGDVDLPHKGAEDFMSPEDIHAMAQAYHQHRSDGGVDRALQIARSHANGGGLIDSKDEHPVVTIMKHLGMPGLHDDKREHYRYGGGDVSPEGLESIQQTHGSEFSSGGNAVTHALSTARKAIKR